MPDTEKLEFEGWAGPHKQDGWFTFGWKAPIGSNGIVYGGGGKLPSLKEAKAALRKQQKNWTHNGVC